MMKNADNMSIAEVEYYVSEFFARVTCEDGHSWIYFPGEDEWHK